ncbi:MAG TPA: hypothetical protein DCL08_05610 [Anaerolineaceae bacterium]|nr:hypothetical protein [Anaerolineaceae bacterium]
MPCPKGAREADTEVYPYTLSEFCYKFYYFEIRLNFTQAFLTIFCFQHPQREVCQGKVEMEDSALF